MPEPSVVDDSPVVVGVSVVVGSSVDVGMSVNKKAYSVHIFTCVYKQWIFDMLGDNLAKADESMKRYAD